PVRLRRRHRSPSAALPYTTLFRSPSGGGDGPLQNGQTAVVDDEVRVHLQLSPQAGTGGAGAEGVVEGEHAGGELLNGDAAVLTGDRKSTRLNSSHVSISYAVFCLK